MATEAKYNLILLRHGQSDWNEKNLFTGWVDVPLTEGPRRGDPGRRAAQGARSAPGHRAHLLAAPRDHDGQPGPGCRGSPLDPRQALLAPQRAPLRRPAGQGQGGDPREIRRGAVHDLAPLLRRPAAPIEDGDEYSQAGDPRYEDVQNLPRTECLKDVLERFLPYWEDQVKSDLKAGRTVLLAAHGNSLRALVKHLDGISDDEITGLNIPTGIPLVYELDANFKPITPGGEYLDSGGCGRVHQGGREPGQEVR